MNKGGGGLLLPWVERAEEGGNGVLLKHPSPEGSLRANANLIGRSLRAGKGGGG